MNGVHKNDTASVRVLVNRGFYESLRRIIKQRGYGSLSEWLREQMRRELQLTPQRVPKQAVDCEEKPVRLKVLMETLQQEVPEERQAVKTAALPGDCT